MKTIHRTVLFCLALLCVSGFAVTAQKPQLVVQTGHARGVFSVAFSADGKLIASGGDDYTIRLWDVRTGAELRSLRGHSGRVNSVAFSPDGQLLASGSDDATIKLWDIRTGLPLRSLTGHPNNVYSVAFSPDGKRLASGSRLAVDQQTPNFHNTVKLWDVMSGALLHTFEGHSDSVNSIAYSPNGRMIASGSADGTIKLWDVITGKQLRTLNGHTNIINSVAFSPDGKVLASGGYDQTMRLWDVEKGEQLRSLVSPEAPLNVAESVAFSPDGRLLASGSTDKTIKLWDVRTGRFLRSLKGHTFFVESIAFSSVGDVLASGSMDNTIKVWDIATGTELRSLGGHAQIISSAAFSPDGDVLAAGSNRVVKLWNMRTGTQLAELEGHVENIQSIAFSPDGRLLASGSWDKTIKLWDVATGTELRSLQGHADKISCVVFSPDGKLLASGSDDNTVKLWDVASGTQIRSLEAGDGGVRSLAFSPNGRILATGAHERLNLWSVTTGKQLRSLEAHAGHAYFVLALVFSPDGKLLASGTSSGAIKLWEVSTGTGRPLFTKQAENIRSLAFSPDGKMLVSGNVKGTIGLWDVVTGRQLRRLTGHDSLVSSVIFSPDGNLLVSGGEDAKIKLWNPTTSQELASLVSLDKDDWVVATPDNRFDTKSLENIEGLHWLMPDAPFTPLPLEIFMRDYYEPQLLPRLIKCNKENNCDREFKPVRDISKLNRVQPPVKIANVSPPDAQGYVNVTVEAGKGQGEYLIDGKASIRTTGVYDLRLFRDGQMVGSWPSDGAEKLLQRTSKDRESNEKLTGEARFLEELRDWQQATEVKPDDTVKVDQKTGMSTLPPFRVKLPCGKDVSQIDFSAYAFNEDRIKSQTARWQWPDDLKAKLPHAQPIKPRSYLITVGVNAYENPDWDLKYAANDARQIQRTVFEKLSQGSEYQEVVPVSLISDYQTKNGQNVVNQKLATKANIRAVLDLLAGKQVEPELFKTIPNADKLRKAEPDDLVIISFSSHGYADNQGNFYFIPYDVGAGSKREITSELLRHCISSDELSLWLRDVDAGEMVMVVDACHSAASVQGEGFKPGPMGSRGLGQLSYDKGIRILTSTQSDDVALETDLTQQGLLTYALTHDGIDAGEADFKPRDGVINLAEWLEYAVARVPKLYGEIETKYEALALNQIKDIGVGQGGRTRLLIFSRDGSNSSLKKGSNQQPSLFDFTRRRKEVVLARTK